MGIDGHCVSDRMGRYITKGPAIGHWVAKRVEGGYFEERSQAIGLCKDDEIIAGVIYENWNRKSIWCHIAIEGRMTGAYLAAIFDYPFNVCQVDKIIVPVGSDNAASIKLVTNMGFVEESRIKDARVDGDIVFYTMKHDACRFLTDKYSRKIGVPHG
jgi:RimJ/RimL family protein N-acetyltransferase